MASIRLAASNIGWKKEDDERIYAKLRQLGYQGLEIAPTRIFPQQPYACASSVTLFAGYLYRRYGLMIPSMQSILNGKTENLFAPDGAFTLTEYLDVAYGFAAACRCPNLVFGCPRNRTMPAGKNVFDADDFFRENGMLAARQGVTLALETVPPCYNNNNFCTRTKDTMEYVKHLGVPGISVNLDVGAMLTNGETVLDVVDGLSLVSHVHISEPELAPIQPRPIHQELALLLKGLNYKGFVSVEMKTTDADSMEAALAYVAEVFA